MKYISKSLVRASAFLALAVSVEKGVRLPAGFKTGDQISPPGGYVGDGLLMRVDVDISPSATCG
jgi:hypothetical protein